MKRKILYIVIIAVLAFFIADNLINYVMMKGVNNFYGLNQKADILLIGHSHLMLATDKEQIERETGLKVSKYTREGVNVSDKKVMIEHFLSTPAADSLRYVLYGVDLATFTGEGLSKNSYKLFYPFLDNEFVDNYVRQQSSTVDYWLHKLVKTTRFNDDGLKNGTVRGWLNNWDNYKNNVIDVESYRKVLENGDERRIKMNPNIMHQFTESIEILTSKGIRVILVNTPTLDLLNDFEPQKYNKIMEWFKGFAAGHQLVDFWDFNPQYASNHSLFSDRLHLNIYGQKVITHEIICGIKKIDNENSN